MLIDAGSDMQVLPSPIHLHLQLQRKVERRVCDSCGASRRRWARKRVRADRVRRASPARAPQGGAPNGASVPKTS